jgi:hypothetical protein
VHVRLAPFAGRRRLTRPAGARLPRARTLLLAALAATSFTSACHRPPPAEDVSISWTLAPTPPVVGSAVLTLRAVDGAGQPVESAKLRVEGHMSHPGMAPVLATTVERGDGVYEAELQFTMRGDWILLVSGSLPGGAAVQQRIDVPGVGSRE